MKVFSAIVGGQLFLAAIVFANPIADLATGLVSARSPAPMPEALPGCIKERGSADEDDVNICCLKLKRDTEAAADTSAKHSALYEKAVAVKNNLKQGGIIAREALPGCIKERGTADEDAVNICCLKLKRDAEAAAVAAASTYASYAEMLAYRSL